MSSLTNFAVTVYVAHALPAAQFGAFGLAYVTYTFALSASRGLATDPFMVRFSGSDVPTWRQAVARCTGTAASAGLVAGACVLAAATVLGGTARLGFLALGLTLPGLMLQDSWRYSFFAVGRGSQAFLNDAIWATALIPGLLFLRLTGRVNVFWFILVWGAAAAVAAAAGPVQARVVPRLSQALNWMSTHRDLGPRYLAENTSNTGASQLRLYGVGIIVGLAAVGYVQAASTLMGPFLVIFMGISLVTVPEAARVVRRSPRRLRPFCLLVGGGLAVLSITWGAILLVALPRGLGGLLLGPIWRPAYPLVLPLTISVAGACMSAGPTAGLHALGAASRSMRAMIIASAAYLVCGVAGAYLGGASGSVRGVAVATWLGALAWWWQLHAGLKQSGIAPADAGLSPVSENGHDHPVPVRALAPSPVDTSTFPLYRAPALARAVTAAARPAHPSRGRMPRAAVRTLIAAGVAALLAVGGITGWTIARESFGASRLAGAPYRAAARTHPHRPAAGRSSAAVAPQALPAIGAASFDPYGDGQSENGHAAALSIDASATTAWSTDWYRTARFGNLKPGTGLLLHLGEDVTITSVQVLLGSPRGADFQLRVGNAAASLADLRTVASATDVGGTVNSPLAQPAHGRYLLIWFTALPPDSSGTFQASVYNVRVEGRR